MVSEDTSINDVDVNARSGGVVVGVGEDARARILVAQFRGLGDALEAPGSVGPKSAKNRADLSQQQDIR